MEVREGSWRFVEEHPENRAGTELWRLSWPGGCSCLQSPSSTFPSPLTCPLPYSFVCSFARLLVSSLVVVPGIFPVPSNLQDQVTLSTDPVAI